MIVRLLIALASVLTLAACSNPPAPASSAPAPVDPATVGTVTGKVVVEGTVAAPTVIRLDGDPKCVSLAAGEPRYLEEVVVGQGNTLQNVFVYIKEGLQPRMYPVPPQPVVLDQQKCRYVPRVLGIQVGQQLAIRNSDPLLHNVRSEGTINDSFDVGTPLQGVEVKKTFATREVMIPFKCNVHAWMRAYVGVLEHPFHDVTDDTGRFSIAQLPPGTYAVEVWHERLGTQSQQVTVAAKETSDLTFTFRAP